MSLKDKFPFGSYRKYQEEVLEELENTEADVVVLDAPVAFGKSAINVAIAREAEDAFVTTPQKSQQDNVYMEDYGEYMTKIMGRGNYKCKMYDDISVEESVSGDICLKSNDAVPECPNNCDYYRRKRIAKESDIVCMNTMYFIVEGFNKEAGFGEREVLIIDECQNLESVVLNLTGMSFTKNTVPDSIIDEYNIPRFSDVEKAVSFLNGKLLPDLADRKGELESLPENNITKDEAKELTDIENMISRIRYILNDDSPYVCIDSKYGFEIQPIRIDDFLRELVWDRAETIVLSSATIPDVEQYLKDVGLYGEDVAHIKVPSPIPAENRPIEYIPVGKMTYNNRDKTIPKIANIVDDIVSNNDEKGLVHTNSHSISKRIYSNMNNKDKVMLYDGSQEQMSIIDEFVNNGKRALLCAGMTEGIDLDGDKCRWQVLAKLNFIPRNEDVAPRNYRRINDYEDGEDWYNFKVALNLMQSYGRGCRSPDDYCEFYIVDKSFGDWWYPNNKDILYDWFKEAIKSSGGISA